ncbi:MAG: hypothetical protein QNK68_03795 [Flavobacteriales bacterium]
MLYMSWCCRAFCGGDRVISGYKVAPEGQISGYMGLWLVNLGIGGFVAGIIANYAAIPKGVTGIIELKHIYLHSFNI